MQPQGSFRSYLQIPVFTLYDIIDSDQNGRFPDLLSIRNWLYTKVGGWKTTFPETFKLFVKVVWKLDQVYCAWLIKWVIKREIIQLTELCLTRWWIISGTWWYWVSIWRYWLVLGQYKLVLLGIRWYRVSKGLVWLYVLEKVEIWSGDTDAWHTDNRI